MPSAIMPLIADPSNLLFFSLVSIWEVAIKFSKGRSDFILHPQVLRTGLLQSGYQELAITSDHIAALTHLPAIHRDPFDRLLLAQAMTDDLVLVTRDAQLLQYPGPLYRG
jgi:PIN domain nuclease of toxin-antitoxin system